MYDRTILRAAAAKRGDTNANRVAVRLGIGRMTAHRLWHGTATPNGETAAAVHRIYRVRPDDLLVPAADADGDAA